MLPAKRTESVEFSNKEFVTAHGQMCPSLLIADLPLVEQFKLFGIRLQQQELAFLIQGQDSVVLSHQAGVLALMVPLLAVLGSYRRPRLLIGVLFFLLGVCLASTPFVVASPASPLEMRWKAINVGAHFSACFVAGSVILLYFERIPRRTIGLLSALSVFFVATQFDYGYALLAPLCLSYVMLSLAYHPQYQFPDFARYGDFSYGIYLYAFPIQQLLVLHYGKSLSPIMLFLLACPVSIAAGAASWHLVERFFMQRKRQGKAVAMLDAAPPLVATAERRPSEPQ